MKYNLHLSINMSCIFKYCDANVIQNTWNMVKCEKGARNPIFLKDGWVGVDFFSSFYMVFAIFF